MKKKAIALTLTAGLVLPTIPVYDPGSLNNFERLLLVNQALAAPGSEQSTAQLEKQIQGLKNKIDNKLPQSLIDFSHNNLAQLKANPSANVDLVTEVWTKISAKKGSAAGYDKLTQENIVKLFLEIAAVGDPKTSANVQLLISDPELRGTVDQLFKLGGLSGGVNDITVGDATDFTRKFINVFNLNEIIKDYLSGTPDGGYIKPGLDGILNDDSLKISKALKNLGITSNDLVSVARRLGVKLVPNSLQVLQQQIQNLRDQLNGKVPQSVINLYHNKLVELRGNPSANVDLVTEVWSKINAKKGNAAGYDKITQENILKLFLAIAVVQDPKSNDALDIILDRELWGTVDQLLKLSGLPGGLNDVSVSDGTNFIAKFISVFNLNNIINDFLTGKNDFSSVKTGLDGVLNDNSLKLGKALKDLGITSDDLLAVAKRFVAKLLSTGGNGNGNGNGSGGHHHGGGGSYIPPVTPPAGGADGVNLSDSGAVIEHIDEADGKSHVAYSFAESYLDSALDILKGSDQQQKTVIVDVSEDKSDIVDIKFPASAWLKAIQTADGADVLILFDGASFRVPFSGINNLEELAEQLGVNLKDLTVKITLKKVTGNDEAALKNRLQQSGYKVVSGIFDFVISVEGGGKSVDISSFGNIYSTRSIHLPEQPDPNQTTGVTYDEQSGQLLFVPTIFQDSTANIRRTGSSIYAVAEGKHTFSDIGSHWAKADIELLASKLIVKGVSDTNFAPEENVKRSEFTSLIVRALGIKDEPFKPKFNDVKDSDWYAGTVIAAVKAGLVDGFEDGNFHPDDLITRQQAAVILARAVAFAGRNPAGGSGYLAKYADKNAIADWAAEAVSKNVEAGIIEGITDSSIAPNEYTTRAQAVAVIKRLLQYVKFIN